MTRLPARVQVSGPGDYYSDDDEQYPYREDSGSECEGDADEEPGGEFAGGEDDDEFVDEDAPGFRYTSGMYNTNAQTRIFIFLRVCVCVCVCLCLCLFLCLCLCLFLSD
jgi:hypothetical protein